MDASELKGHLFGKLFRSAIFLAIAWMIAEDHKVAAAFLLVTAASTIVSVWQGYTQFLKPAPASEPKDK